MVARVLEVAIHKIHELKFPLNQIVHGLGFAPLPPIAKDFVNGMGRTNDSIIYGGVVQLMMRGSDEELNKLSKNLQAIPQRIMENPSKKSLKVIIWIFIK